ncbi:slipin family protein [Elusimicrobiota bacterium]
MEMMTMTVMLVGAVALAAVLVIRRAFVRVEVMEYERGLLYRKGRYVATLGPGRYALIVPVLGERVVTVDARLTSVAVPGQEILTADKLPVRLTVIAQYRIADAAKAVNEAANYLGLLYEDIQLALRELVAAKELEGLLSEKTEIGKALAEAVRPKAAAYGLALEAAGLKDVVLPGNLKNLLQCVEEAKQEARAKLVTAREELAAVRCRLNTAKLMKDNPVLLRLKELEVMSECAKQPGATIILSSPADLAVKPKA